MKTIRTIINGLVAVGMVCFMSMPAKAFLLIDFLLAPEPTPVSDPVSIAPQTVVQGIQNVLSTYTAVEQELQGQLRNLHFEPEFMGIKLTIEANNQMAPIAKGLLTADPLTEKYAGMSAKDLAADAQTILTTVSGTIDSVSNYMQMRRYEEQASAIEMLAAVLVLKNGTEQVQDMLRKFDMGKYETAENYKAALEGNLAVSTVYNQMLSLEQQVTAMRLNTLSSQRMITASPISKGLSGQ